MDKDTKPEEMSQGPMISVGSPGEPPPPGMTPAFKVELEEARESEDYHGIYRDLEFVVSVTRQLRGVLLQQSSQPSDVPSSVGMSDNVLRSLWLAALVTYGRCFHQGKRRWLDESVFEGETEGVLEWHRYFRNTRDKHVAHSVNPFEVHATRVEITDHGGNTPRVEGVITLYAIRGNEPPEVVGYLEWLATYVRDAVWKKHTAASNRVLEKAKSLRKEQLQKLRPLEVVPQ